MSAVVFRIPFYFRHPQALAIDSAAVRLTVVDAKGHRAEQMLRIPIRYHQQNKSDGEFFDDSSFEAAIYNFVVWTTPFRVDECNGDFATVMPELSEGGRRREPMKSPPATEFESGRNQTIRP